MRSAQKKRSWVQPTAFLIKEKCSGRESEFCAINKDVYSWNAINKCAVLRSVGSAVCIWLPACSEFSLTRFFADRASFCGQFGVRNFVRGGFKGTHYSFFKGSCYFKLIIVKSSLCRQNELLFLYSFNFKLLKNLSSNHGRFCSLFIYCDNFYIVLYTLIFLWYVTTEEFSSLLEQRRRAFLFRISLLENVLTFGYILRIPKQQRRDFFANVCATKKKGLVWQQRHLAENHAQAKTITKEEKCLFSCFPKTNCVQKEQY